MNLNLNLAYSININSKWIIDLSLKQKTILFVDNIRESLQDLDFGTEFLDMTPRV